MNTDLARSWKDVFAFVAEQKAEEKRVKRLEALSEAFDRQERDTKQADQKRVQKEAEEEKTSLRTLATVEQIAAFSETLDDMDTATVHALMANGERLDRVNVELQGILDRAYVLPDGRRVFKDDDGHRVFDETGAELQLGTIDPAVIDDSRPRVSLLLTKRDERLRIEAERHGLHQFETRIDEARAHIKGGHATGKDIESMKADLDAAMPEAAKAKLERHPDGNNAVARTATGSTPLADDLDTALRAAAPGPGPR